MKCSIKLKSFNHILLDSILKNCLNDINKINLEKVSIIRLPKKIKKFSLIKSPHVHKKSREQFEIIHYTRILHLSGSKKNIETFLNNKIINNKHTFYYKVQWYI
jgi:small subunit ribosomal protein S10